MQLKIRKQVKYPVCHCQSIFICLCSEMQDYFSIFRPSVRWPIVVVASECISVLCGIELAMGEYVRRIQKTQNEFNSCSSPLFGGNVATFVFSRLRTPWWQCRDVHREMQTISSLSLSLCVCMHATSCCLRQWRRPSRRFNGRVCAICETATVHAATATRSSSPGGIKK